MHSEDVLIVVGNQLITVKKVICEPYMPKDKLKKLAVDTYLARQKEELYESNGISK